MPTSEPAGSPADRYKSLMEWAQQAPPEVQERIALLAERSRVLQKLGELPARVKCAERALLHQLATRAIEDPDYEVTATIPELAQWSKLGRRAVQYSVKRLKKEKYLAIELVSGIHKASIYRVIWLHTTPIQAEDGAQSLRPTWGARFARAQSLRPMEGGFSQGKTGAKFARAQSLRPMEVLPEPPQPAQGELDLDTRSNAPQDTGPTRARVEVDTISIFDLIDRYWNANISDFDVEAADYFRGQLFKLAKVFGSMGTHPETPDDTILARFMATSRERLKELDELCTELMTEWHRGKKYHPKNYGWFVSVALQRIQHITKEKQNEYHKRRLELVKGSSPNARTADQQFTADLTSEIAAITETKKMGGARK